MMNEDQAYINGALNQVQADTDLISTLVFENEGEFLQVMFSLDADDYEVLSVHYNEVSVKVTMLFQGTGKTITGSVEFDKFQQWVIKL